ncbi:MAG: hypothetical protein K2I22_03800 [Lachnospiraceae bacterium]|nr:hypothetical protein [Lachnospiraceae bacterium]
MATIQKVTCIDDNIKINRVLVSCTNKIGLTSNAGISIDGYPENGIIGELSKINPDILFISTGNTFQVLKKAGFNVIELSEYTGYPEMKTGLVKSLHPKIHAGILGHVYTDDDREFMQEHEIYPIDLVIINFYDLQKEIDNNTDIESKRQAIDIGGPTLCHAARKSFIHTALLTSNQEYMAFMNHVRTNHGSISLKYRLELAQKASALYTELMLSVNNIVQNISYEELENTYKIL